MILLAPCHNGHPSAGRCDREATSDGTVRDVQHVRDSRSAGGRDFSGEDNNAYRRVCWHTAGGGG